MSKPFTSNATSSHDIVMQMLSDICQSLSPSLQLVVTVLSRKCCQLYVKAFLAIATGNQGIAINMLSAIYRLYRDY
jgi:hypothetical protein